MHNKILKVKEESNTGLNTSFINEATGRTISREQAIDQINKGNPTYEGYHVVSGNNGADYIRSNPDKSSKNNIE